MNHSVTRAWLMILLAIPLAAFGSAHDAGPLPSGSLSGTIVGPEGKPVAGASVFIDDFDYDASGFRPVSKTISRDDGSFRLESLEPVYRSRKDLRVVAQGFAPYTAAADTITVYPSIDSNLGQIRLNRGEVISGQVLDADGIPRAGATVECQARRYRSYVASPLTPTYRLTTDAQGRFATPPLPVSFAGLTVRAAGREMPSVRVPVGPEGRLEVDPIRLRPCTPITGTVYDEAGKPLAGANIYGENSYSSMWMTHDGVTTDSSGRFVLEGLDARCRIMVDAKDCIGIDWAVRKGTDGLRWNGDRYWTGRADQLHGPVGELKITMTSFAWIEGRAIDADTGSPVHLENIVRCSFARKPGGEIVLNGCYSPPFQREADGVFRLPYEIPQEYHLTLTAAGYEEAEAFTPPVARLQPVNGIVVRMHKAKDGAQKEVRHQTISGTVRRDGKPITTGWIGLARPCSQPDQVNVGICRGRTVTTQGGVSVSSPIRDGAYSLNVRYQDDDWLVEIQEPGRPVIRIGPVAVGVNEAKKLDITLVQGGSISGRVEAIAAGSANGLWVVAFTRAGLLYETPVGPDGRFSFGELPPDVYGLKAGHDAFSDGERPLEPLANDDPAFKTPADPWKRAKVVKVDSDQFVKDVRLELPGS